jgi:endogenous inhibitor of DNA gyrase (YacG/DUF329 family)
VAENKFSLEDRLRYGNLEINEICELKPCSRSRFYQDVKAGLVEIRKVGSKSVVPGPIAKKYISCEPIREVAGRRLVPCDNMEEPSGNCPQCGHDIGRDHNGARYCSNRCKQRAYRLRLNGETARKKRNKLAVRDASASAPHKSNVTKQKGLKSALAMALGGGL